MFTVVAKYTNCAPFWVWLAVNTIHLYVLIFVKADKGRDVGCDEQTFERHRCQNTKKVGVAKKREKGLWRRICCLWLIFRTCPFLFLLLFVPSHPINVLVWSIRPIWNPINLFPIWSSCSKTIYSCTCDAALMTCIPLGCKDKLHKKHCQPYPGLKCRFRKHHNY